MFEKVNPSHPDKIADRIAGALVDLAYKWSLNPKVAIEVLIGHRKCHIIAETSVKLPLRDVKEIVHRIAGRKIKVEYKEYNQDEILSKNQIGKCRCGDNGIFKGVPITIEEQELTLLAQNIYRHCHFDGKYILDKKTNKLIICQSNANLTLASSFHDKLQYPNAIINPLGYWTGGTDVDTGATNRKLGSDMGFAVTGGGLHGKDLTKADVSVNIYAFLKAQETGKTVKLFCAIGDAYVDGKPYTEIVEIARQYIKRIGGFEKFAEWGLIR